MHWRRCSRLDRILPASLCRAGFQSQHHQPQCIATGLATITPRSHRCLSEDRLDPREVSRTRNPAPGISAEGNLLSLGCLTHPLPAPGPRTGEAPMLCAFPIFTRFSFFYFQMHHLSSMPAISESKALEGRKEKKKKKPKQTAEQPALCCRAPRHRSPPQKSQPTDPTVIGAGAQLTFGLSSSLPASLSSACLLPATAARTSGSGRAPVGRQRAGVALDLPKLGGLSLSLWGWGTAGHPLPGCPHARPQRPVWRQRGATFILPSHGSFAAAHPPLPAACKRSPLLLLLLPSPLPFPILLLTPVLSPRLCHPPESAPAGCALNSCGSGEHPRGGPGTPSPLGRCSPGPDIKSSCKG